MAMHSQVYMPGAFHHEGVHADLFRPPNTSPSSPSGSGFLPNAPSPVGDDGSNTKRKRTRQGTSDAPRRDAVSAVFETPGHTQGERTNYRLAGSLDSTPGTFVDSNAAMGDSVYSDSDYRRMLGTKRRRDDAEATPNAPLFTLYPSMQEPQLQPHTPTSGWGTFAVSTIGGVIGRVWQFCKAGAFTGFHAGGGRGYVMNPPLDDASMFQDDFLRDGDANRVPGRYPLADDQQMEDQPARDSRASTPTAPAAKRRQTTAGDELGRNWVMVRDPETPNTPRGSVSRASGVYNRPSPRNRNQGPSVTTGRRISTPASRRSTLGHPSRGALSTPTVAAQRPASSASYASPRSPSPTKAETEHRTPPASSPAQRGPVSRRRRTSPPMLSPMPTHRRSQSGASVASSRAAPADAENSPRLDAEAKKLAARRKMEDRDTDYRINSFNKQLQDMIRQGKEALGTTIEVEGADGGWEDDELL
jgi:hypothetical protein